MRTVTAQRTSEGGRSPNEDCVGYEVGDEWGCWVVADGLGGHADGADASHHAVEAVLASARENKHTGNFNPGAYINAANLAVLEAQSGSGAGTMRSTVAVLERHRDRVLWAHVGDTRLYFFRAGALIHQTADHSVPQLLAETGAIRPEEIRTHADRSRLLRALGSDKHCRPSIPAEPVQLQPQDSILLCSDGWWEFVTETEMATDRASAQTPEVWLENMSDRIRQRATGSFDNYSALALFVQGDTA